MLYRILSRLLDYPDEALFAHFPEIRKAALSLPQREGKAVLGLIAWMEDLSLTELQAAYVETFDLNPDHSLYLTYHLLGDDRGRGPAMVNLSEHYKAMGFEAGEELPDYLPLILEYLSLLDETEARFFLNQAGEAIGMLAARLEGVQSPYAGVMRLIEHRARLVERNE